MTTFKNQGIVIHEDISDVGISLTKDIVLSRCRQQSVVTSNL